MEERETLPNAAAVLVLGICSIVFFCFFIGLVLGIVGLAISGNSVRMYKEAPARFDGWGMLNAGRILSIIGIVLGGLYILYYVIVILIIGAAGLTMWDMQHHT